MNLIEFFGTVIKPKICKGRFMLAPLNNQKIGDNIFALRDKDVNAFVYKKDGGTIAIDCGYKNSKNIPFAIKELAIDENGVTDLFLTHLDLDHAGGVDVRCGRIYLNAKIYLGEIESGYLTGRLCRKKLGFIRLNTPIKLESGYNLLADNQTVMCGNIKVQALLVQGHTMGHLCYLIDDKYLFSGDSVILVKGIGHSFYKLWNYDDGLNHKSLERLKALKDIEKVITSHSGLTADIEKAFQNLQCSPKWKEKGYKVDDNAPYNPFAKEK
jgi:glyoxylase-like metal-dependent hydrolase (beta-lactamase superfamily II)